MMGLILTNDNKWMRTVKIDSRPNDWYYNYMIWCQKHCTGEWNITPGYLAFEKEADATFFILMGKQ